MLLIALPTTIPCKLCLPCITPPCYKQEPGVSYTGAAPTAAEKDARACVALNMHSYLDLHSLETYASRYLRR